MGIVARIRRILVVGDVNGDTSRLFFRCIVDLVDSAKADLLACHVQNMEDRRGQGCFSMVNVTNGADVNVRLISLKFFCHIILC